MGALKSNRIASYLAALQESEYGISSTVSGVINYLLDSYYAKLDQRTKPPKPVKWYPDDPHAHVREVWLQTDLYKCVSLNRSYPTWARSLNAYAFWCLFDGPTSSYEIIPFLDVYEFRDMLKGHHGYRIQSEMITIAFNNQVRLPIFGNFFVQHRGSGIHLFVSLDLCYELSSCNVTVMVAPNHAAEAEQFLAAMDASIIANDIYYRRCLSYECNKLDFCVVTPTTWTSIIMKPQVKDNIRQNTVSVLEHTELLNSLGMCPNRNLMLISPPGMAKTTIFRAVSCDVEGTITRIWCTGKSIEYPEHVTQLFAAARALAPCIVFIEDMDLFGRDRSLSSSINPRVLNEFLAMLDGAQENAGVVVMASTNDVVSMDEALINRPGRFDVKIEIPFPDADDRLNMLNKFLTDFHACHDSTVTKDVIQTVINMTDGLTGDYMKSLVKTVVIRAVSDNKSDGKSVIFGAEHIINAAEQVIKNYQIGKRAKRHHVFEGEIKAAFSNEENEENEEKISGTSRLISRSDLGLS
jgi:AAA+ superfamily predicted ATPase